MASQGTGRYLARVLCAAGSFLGPLLTGMPARAEVISLADMLRGITMTPQQCAAKPLTVWINTSSGGYCMRYYLSTVGGEGRSPTVFLQGDRLGVANLRTGTFKGSPKDKNINTDDLQRTADMFSRKTGGPAIYLGRIGVEGSSGNHIVRHTVLELQVTNAALNGIKQRYRYEGFHLAGQSGGGTLVGGLLGLRQDIGCAVPGSGRLALVTTPKRRPHLDPSQTPFDASESVALIARSRARILVVTDPEDKRVPLRDQSAFVERLRRAGGQAEQFFVQATDEDHHGTVAYSATAVAGCIRGENTQMIAQKLAEQVRTRLAAAKAKAEKQIVETTRPRLTPGLQTPAPRPMQVSQLPQQPLPPAYQQLPTSRPPVQTTQLPSSPTVQMPQPTSQQRPAPTYQAQVAPTVQPNYPQQRQYQLGYPQYRLRPTPTYQVQAPTIQPIYPQQRQYQLGYPQYQQRPTPTYQAQAPAVQPIYPQQRRYPPGYQQTYRPTSPAPIQKPLPYFSPQQPTYQQPPIQPVSPHLGYVPPPVRSPQI